jgi:hypothetical protein
MLSVVVHNSKNHDEDSLLQVPLVQHVVKFSLSYAGVISELILCVGVLGARSATVWIYGIALLLSRVVLAAPPGVLLMYAIFCGGEASVDEQGRRTFKYYLDTTVVTKNTKIYVGVIVLGLFEPPLLAFLPWYRTEFSEAAQFPTLGIMRLCYGFKVLQLVVTLTAQVGLLVLQVHSAEGTDNTAGTIIILNVTFTCINAVFKGFEMFLKSSVLRGTTKSNDCEAARRESGLEGIAVGRGSLSLSDTAAQKEKKEMGVELGWARASGSTTQGDDIAATVNRSSKDDGDGDVDAGGGTAAAGARFPLSVRMSYMMNPMMSIKNKLSAAADDRGAPKGKAGEGMDNEGGSSGWKEKDNDDSSRISQPLLQIMREALSSEREAREAMRTEFDEKLALLSGHGRL